MDCLAHSIVHCIGLQTVDFTGNNFTTTTTTTTTTTATTISREIYML